MDHGLVLSFFSLVCNECCLSEGVFLYVYAMRGFPLSLPFERARKKKLFSKRCISFHKSWTAKALTERQTRHRDRHRDKGKQIGKVQRLVDRLAKKSREIKEVALSILVQSYTTCPLLAPSQSFPSLYPLCLSLSLPVPSSRPQFRPNGSHYGYLFLTASLYLSQK